MGLFQDSGDFPLWLDLDLGTSDTVSTFGGGGGGDGDIISQSSMTLDLRHSSGKHQK
jgi:hypothetical protein